ncbi:MAG: class C sortase [Oscillospiraceae bacterium]|nr:class C sortase [Oscillospiraceae bacterium]
MRKKASVSTIIWIVIFLVGLGVMLYPSFSNWWNTHTQGRVIANYTEAVARIDDETYEKMLAAAHVYNKQLAETYAPLTNFKEIPDYDQIIDVSGTGIMGYITIPQINVELPIYHGTSQEVLNIAVGHLQGSSFPVGGENTHAVLSAHRGLPSARLFTDLDKLRVGDSFMVTILDEVLTYEVEEILIVKPEEMDKLAIIPGGDYVTLMTCTPYGVNTHRLLLRSHRIETAYEKAIRISADAVQVDQMLVVPIIAAPLVVLLFIYWEIDSRRKNKQEHRQSEIHSSKYMLPL